VLRWPDGDQVHKSVVGWTEQLLKTRTDVVLVGYFGSYARNEWGPGSDLDILVVLEDSPLPFGKRSLGHGILDLPVSVDLLVYTVREFHDLGKHSAMFHERLMKEAVWTYGPGSGC
jgi:predicted nucleotidyltransferase